MLRFNWGSHIHFIIHLPHARLSRHLAACCVRLHVYIPVLVKQQRADSWGHRALTLLQPIGWRQKGNKYSNTDPAIWRKTGPERKRDCEVRDSILGREGLSKVTCGQRPEKNERMSLWWLILCVTLVRPQDVQKSGETLFLDTSVEVFLRDQHSNGPPG